MADYGTPISPMEEEPKSNRKTIIIIAVVVVVCCCCAVVGGGGLYWLWNNGDSLLEGLGQHLLPALLF